MHLILFPNCGLTELEMGQALMGELKKNQEKTTWWEINSV